MISEEGRLRFTVVITSYNLENYIERAIESVLNQEFKNYEIIVVDDCSTDNTIEKIKNYKNKNLYLYKTKENSGKGGAPRNIAIEKAKGEYIVFLDGDDTLYDMQTLKKIDNIIGQDKPDIVYLGYEEIGKNGNRTRISTKENSMKKQRIMCDISFSVSARCWRREFLIENDIKFVEKMYYEDEVFCLKGSILAKETKYGDFEIFKYYRNRVDSVMNIPNIGRCSDWYRALAEITDLYKITPEEYRPYLLSFIKNENDTIPKRIAYILSAYKNGEAVKPFPKREYTYKEFFDDEN